eukprot:GHVU01098276.1.p1 GENE.GHVU01098276.1~~GHVU01098276.1.p1  ORF type:complete len:151 (+),score=2.75 GHVU01098276.1:23-454(+)
MTANRVEVYLHDGGIHEFRHTLPASRRPPMEAGAYTAYVGAGVADIVRARDFAQQLTEEEAWCIVSSVYGCFEVYTVHAQPSTLRSFIPRLRAGTLDALDMRSRRGNVRAHKCCRVLRMQNAQGGVRYRPLRQHPRVPEPVEW